MTLPENLQQGIEDLLSKEKGSDLKKAFEKLSKAYRKNDTSQFFDEKARLAYLASRVPATYAVAYHVLSKLPTRLNSWIDVGAGPGTASWAAATLFPEAQKMILFEKSREMAEIGQKMAAENQSFAFAKWICGSIPPKTEKVDAAIFSYSLGELNEPLEWVDWWWKADTSQFILIEPGTPERFSLLRKVRETLIAKGAIIIAPCTHLFACPIQGKDWCHFSTRFNRSRLQRYLKEGELGYEDEKYCYLIASKTPLSLPQGRSRILRHPQKRSGFIELTLCTAKGEIEKKNFSKREKKSFLQAKKARWGDSFEIVY